MPWARASSLDRHLECPAASHLPRLDRGKWEPGYLTQGLFVAPVVAVEERDSFAADWGTAMHAAKANSSEAQDPFLTWVDPHREILWPTRLGLHEVAVSYDCRTGEVTTFQGTKDETDKWKTSRGPDSVTGSCDWWARLPTGEPWIDDLKTGWKEPLVVTPQTLFYLMCRMKEANRGTEDPWTTGRVSITHWPRAKEPTEPTRSGLWRQVTDTALLAFEGELKTAWVRAAGSNPEPRPGAHCLYCPSASVCDRANG